MAHFEHVLNRLLAIEWWEPVEPSQFDALAMINEHFRRLALWCGELNIEEPHYWHFTNLAHHFHPDLMMPDNDLLNEEGRIEIPGVAGTTRLMMHHALDWAYLLDVYPEIAALYDHLPYPYEPALKVFDKRIAIGYHDYSYEYRLERITENGDMMIGPIFELGRPEYYLQLMAYHEADV